MFLGIRSHVLLKEYHITVSLGLTTSVAEDTEDSILSRADKALYEAKEKGRNRYFYGIEGLTE